MAADTSAAITRARRHLVIQPTIGVATNGSRVCAFRPDICRRRHRVGSGFLIGPQDTSPRLEIAHTLRGEFRPARSLLTGVSRLQRPVTRGRDEIIEGLRADTAVSFVAPSVDGSIELERTSAAANAITAS